MTGPIGVASPGLFGACGPEYLVPKITPIVENQMEKKMENEMEAGII